MRKYEPLQRLLRRQNGDEVLLTFRQIEYVLRDLLPKGAQEPQWWANESGPTARQSHCHAWLDVGFKAFLLKGAEQVRFQRATRSRIGSP